MHFWIIYSGLWHYVRRYYILSIWVFEWEVCEYGWEKTKICIWLWLRKSCAIYVWSIVQEACVYVQCMWVSFWAGFGSEQGEAATSEWRAPVSCSRLIYIKKTSMLIWLIVSLNCMNVIYVEYEGAWHVFISLKEILILSNWTRVWLVWGHILKVS